MEAGFFGIEPDEDDGATVTFAVVIQGKPLAS